MLRKIKQILKERERTPAWLCRRAGIAHSTYTRVAKGEKNLTENLKNRFSKALGIEKEKLFPEQKTGENKNGRE